MTGPVARERSLDVYLQPAVVGGGLGDIEEVLAVGRRLERQGWTLFLYRKSGRPLPRSVDGPWGWPAVRRVSRLGARSPRALTVTPWWGVSARPIPERTGPPGPWSVETSDIEACYGANHVVHLSIEEFGRTLTSQQQARERWREGGVPVRTIARRLKGPSAARERQIMHEAYRTWRAFDRPNVLHLFAGFRPSRAFAREFPEAVQTGPLWPGPSARARPIRRRWVWYASPSTSGRLAVALAGALPAAGRGFPPIEIEVRGPHPLLLPPGPGIRWRWNEPTSPVRWSRPFHAAELRIVTGSRTLLEALADGGPFLYFNGVLNQGRRTRRHRPEKVDTLLEVWRRHGVASTLRRDLADFSRLRRVGPIVQRAVRDPRWRAQFPDRAAAVDFPRGWRDAGRLIAQWVTEWASSKDPSTDLVRRWRARGRDPRFRL
jgi:hypothetical protein